MFTFKQLEFESGPDSHFADRAVPRVSKCPFTRFMQSLKEIELFGASRNILSVISWIRSFIAKPNAELGRQGAVCPFMARALNSDSIFFKSIDFSSLSKENLDDFIRDHAEIFLNTAPTQGKARLNKAIVLLFDNLPENSAREIIEETQCRLKPFFVERGLMLGEFHQNHQGEGIHNKDFRPLQSPVPLLIVRHLIPSDIIFLNRKSDSASRRVHFISSYLRMFQNTLPSKLNQIAVESHEEALKEMSLGLA